VNIIERVKKEEWTVRKPVKNRQSKSAAKKVLPIWAWIIFPLLIIAGIVFSLIQAQKPSAMSAVSTSLPSEISVAQAAQAKDQGAFILDVRQPEEWAQFHIPGATLIPLGELPDRLKEVPQDRQVVVVCRSGKRSAQGRDILLKAGFSQVTSMAGGLTEWQAQGLPTTTGE
jgi:rhodanese-related sulfurtransferase